MAVGVVAGLTSALLIGQQRPVQAEQKPQEQRWEYKVITLPAQSDQATEQLNKLAAVGWEYVGLINTAIPSVVYPDQRQNSGVSEKPGHESWVILRRSKS
ncbi:hypothetical protein FRUB_03475 [Fimbriiglobus ruber]|uniref:DUF4177 domain-containing protein n=2 Tax=Fimbriiglobus ruber TaxID=1908690 RepID=A0A225E1H9_9BACT|nr:hypothetical protein FRUB_03475 [Fimbriiglobus ruber]